MPTRRILLYYAAKAGSLHDREIFFMISRNINPTVKCFSSKPVKKTEPDPKNEL